MTGKRTTTTDKPAGMDSDLHRAHQESALQTSSSDSTPCICQTLLSEQETYSVHHHYIKSSSSKGVKSARLSRSTEERLMQ